MVTPILVKQAVGKWFLYCIKLIAVGCALVVFQSPTNASDTTPAINREVCTYSVSAADAAQQAFLASRAFDFAAQATENTTEDETRARQADEATIAAIRATKLAQEKVVPAKEAFKKIYGKVIQRDDLDHAVQKYAAAASDAIRHSLAAAKALKTAGDAVNLRVTAARQAKAKARTSAAGFARAAAGAEHVAGPQIRANFRSADRIALLAVIDAARANDELERTNSDRRYSETLQKAHDLASKAKDRAFGATLYRDGPGESGVTLDNLDIEALKIFVRAMLGGHLKQANASLIVVAGPFIRAKNEADIQAMKEKLGGIPTIPLASSAMSEEAREASMKLEAARNRLWEAIIAGGLRDAAVLAALIRKIVEEAFHFSSEYDRYIPLAWAALGAFIHEAPGLAEVSSSMSHSAQADFSGRASGRIDEFNQGLRTVRSLTAELVVSAKQARDHFAARLADRNRTAWIKAAVKVSDAALGSPDPRLSDTLLSAAKAAVEANAPYAAASLVAFANGVQVRQFAAEASIREILEGPVAEALAQRERVFRLIAEVHERRKAVVLRFPYFVRERAVLYRSPVLLAELEAERVNEWRQVDNFSKYVVKYARAKQDKLSNRAAPPKDILRSSYEIFSKSAETLKKIGISTCYASLSTGCQASEIAFCREVLSER